MNRKLFFLVSMVVLVLGGFVSCENEPEQVFHPEFEWIEGQAGFENGVLTVGPDGGHFEIAYELKDASEEMQVVIDGGAEWIFTDAKIDGKVLVAVLPNEGDEAREAELTFSVSGASDMAPIPAVCVHQDAVYVEPEKDPSFEITLQAMDDYLSAWFSITPLDKEMTYFAGISTESIMEKEGFMTDDEALFKADMKRKGNLNMAFKNAYKGDVFDVIFKFLYPNETYILFVYGAEKQKGKAVRTTEVVRYSFKTKDVLKYPSDFDYKYDMYGNLIRISIQPKGYDGLYYPTLKECKHSTDEEFLKYDMYYEWMNLMHHYTSMGFTMAEIIEMNCCTGDFTSPLMEMEPDEKYFFTIVPVNEEGYLCSDIKVDIFESGSRFAPSPDNTFEISVDNITSESAEVKVVPSMGLEPYAVAIVDASKKDKSDDWIVDEVKDYGYQFTNGTFQGTFDLMPDHEYMVVAFGFYSGYRVTPVERKIFTTAAVELKSDVQVSSTQDAFYSCEEIAELDPDFEYDMWVDCVAFFHLAFDPEAEVDYYYLGYLSDRYIYDKTVTDQDIIGKLLTGKKRYVADGLNPGCYVSFGDEMLLAAIAVDKEGNLSQLHKCKYTFKKSERSPAEEFMERFGTKAGAPALVIPFVAE